MKKLFHLFTLCFSLSVFSATFAYTSTDVSNAQFLAEKGIIKEQKNEKDYRLDSTISRAETVKMALAIKGVTIPTKYTCKKYFSDVTKNDWVCAAVELAADHGLVSRENQKFRPSEVISRVEILKIIINTSSLQFPVGAENNRYNDGAGDWQKKLISQAFSRGLWTGNSTDTLYQQSINSLIFSPNQPTLRDEVFQLVYNTMHLQYLDKNPLLLNTDQLNTDVSQNNQTNFFIVSGVYEKLCTDPKNTFLMGYGPAKDQICGTKEYNASNVPFLKAGFDFKSGKYAENIAIICPDCYHQPESFIIHDNHIFMLRGDFGGGGATFIEIVVRSDFIASRELGHVDFVPEKTPNTKNTHGDYTEAELEFYKKILNSLFTPSQ